MKFFKIVLAVIVGCFCFFFISLLFFILIASFFAPKEDSLEIKEHSILSLDFQKEVYEYSNPIHIKDFDFDMQQENTLTAVLRAIKEAKTDSNIQGIVLGSTKGVKGRAHLQNIREAVEDFKASGKFVYAFSEGATQSDYLLQSVADSIFVGTLSEISVQGLSAEVLYYKDLQENTGIHMEIFRHGKYKSAVEPFLENNMSEANREQIKAYLSSLWNSYAADVAQSRGISVDALNQIADSLWGRTPELALSHHLVDKIAFRDEFEKSLCKATGTQKVKDFHLVPIEKYTKKVALDYKEKRLREKKEQQIAIIFCNGEIVEGPSQEGLVGNESIIEALRQARDKESIKAIILRINSPGGSGLASELIHREIALTQKVKPVYTSMGNLAASGGYYIACNSKRIFADKQTLTGSIGVFGMIPNLKELADRWGVNSEQVQTHPYALTYSLFEKTPEKTRQVITEGIELFYKRFVQRVADGRKMTWEQVDTLAQGRVWTGADALEKGLVDEIGNLQQAIAYAAKENNLSEGAYDLLAYPVIEIEFSDYMKKRFRASTQAELNAMLREEIGAKAYEGVQQLRRTIPTSAAFLQARIPYDVYIK